MNITISKEEVIKKIDEATLEEEKALPVYASHIASALFWAGLSEEHKTEIVSKLQILHDDSLRHVKMLEEVKRIYQSK